MRSWRWGPMMEFVSLWEEEEIRVLFLSAMWINSENVAICKPGRGEKGRGNGQREENSFSQWGVNPRHFLLPLFPDASPAPGAHFLPGIPKSKVPTTLPTIEVSQLFSRCRQPQLPPLTAASWPAHQADRMHLPDPGPQATWVSPGSTQSTDFPQ